MLGSLRGSDRRLRRGLVLAVVKLFSQPFCLSLLGVGSSPAHDQADELRVPTPLLTIVGSWSVGAVAVAERRVELGVKLSVQIIRRRGIDRRLLL